eukprot:gb/GECG01015580.1/.p1 GENE.gb/GECG01015580.1/~~gb/GECG01015580.1/.p1  ORF type:complete len:374 (+),score=58.18 gb/GECG01015580.1/:1-1122(+)
MLKRTQGAGGRGGGNKKRNRNQSDGKVEKDSKKQKQNGSQKEEEQSGVLKQFRPSQAKSKNRTLVLSTRGITARYRHLMEDLKAIMPHHKKESKMDTKDNIRVANELAEVNSCNNTILFEVRKKRDLYLWIAKSPHGPSVKFHVVNVHTMDELRLTGNCLKGSRPLLSFDQSFNSAPHLQLLKELFTQVFHVPHKHPKSQPFHDHVMAFYVVDNKIWIRHYQIADESSDKKTREQMVAKGQEPTSLVEIGPRFVCDIIRIFAGAFGGPTIYFNENYVSPNKVRHEKRYAEAQHKAARVESKQQRAERAKELVVPRSELDTVFGEGGDRVDFEQAETVIGYGASRKDSETSKGGPSSEVDQEQSHDSGSDSSGE